MLSKRDELRATPLGFQDGFPRGEQNTLRRSNIEVGEGKSVLANLEVMLSIPIESLEGEPEILSKTALNDPTHDTGGSPLCEAARRLMTASLNSCDITVVLPSAGLEEISAEAKISSVKNSWEFNRASSSESLRLAPGACPEETMPTSP
jgi:hypothetical protein